MKRGHTPGRWAQPPEVKKSARKLKFATSVHNRNVAQQVAANSRVLAQVKQLQKKGVDRVIATGAIISTTSTNGNIHLMNGIALGDGSWNRRGKRCIMKSLRIKGSFNVQHTTNMTDGTNFSTAIRMLLVWDKSPNGAATPPFDQFFGITDQSGAESCPDIWAPPRYDNMDRFKVLMERTINPSQVGFPSAPAGLATWNSLAPETIPVDEYVKLGSRETVFLGEGAPSTIADIQTGALYLIFRSYSNNVNILATFDGTTRLRYDN